MSAEAVEQGGSKPPSALKNFVAGGAGGMALVFAGHPLDTIKVTLQNMKVVPGQKPQYSGVVDCATQIVKKDGFLALYKGMAMPLAGVTPMYAMCFLGYGFGKQIFCDKDAFEKQKLVQIGLAGATSAVFTTPILAPGERIKCNIQANPQFKNTKPTELIKILYKEGGILNVSRGFTATMLRDGVASAAYFSSYEVLKSMFTPEGEKAPTALGTVTAGGLAGMLNWAVCLPLDTLKTRLQMAPYGQYKHGIRSVFLDVVKTEGPLALYRGLGAALARAFPANGACFLAYEGALTFMTSMGIE